MKPTTNPNWQPTYGAMYINHEGQLRMRFLGEEMHIIGLTQFGYLAPQRF